MRIFIFILLILLATALGAFYGAVYEQLTYTISNEFFTKMRFLKFGIEGDINERWEVAKIGIYYTWKVGLVIGILLSLVGLLHSSNKKMFFVTLQSFAIVVATSMAFLLIALVFSKPTIETAIEINVVNKAAFNKVLSMNNYTYVGGVIGMFIGIGWQVMKTRTSKNTPSL